MGFGPNSLVDNLQGQTRIVVFEMKTNDIIEDTRHRPGFERGKRGMVCLI